MSVTSMNEVRQYSGKQLHSRKPQWNFITAGRSRYLAAPFYLRVDSYKVI